MLFKNNVEKVTKTWTYFKNVCYGPSDDYKISEGEDN